MIILLYIDRLQIVTWPHQHCHIKSCTVTEKKTFLKQNDHSRRLLNGVAYVYEQQGGCVTSYSSQRLKLVCFS